MALPPFQPPTRSCGGSTVETTMTTPTPTLSWCDMWQTDPLVFARLPQAELDRVRPVVVAAIEAGDDIAAFRERLRRGEEQQS
jgi:hypothetical protein